MSAPLAGQFSGLNLLGGVRYAGGGISSSGNEMLCRQLNQNGGVLALLSCRAATPVPAGATVTIDVLLDGVATGLTVTITPAHGSTLVQDLTHYAIPPIYSGVSFRATPAGIIVGSVDITCSVQGG